MLHQPIDPPLITDANQAAQDIAADVLRIFLSIGRRSGMQEEEVDEQTGEARPPILPQAIGEHKCGDIDSLQPTPERKAKTGAKW